MFGGTGSLSSKQANKQKTQKRDVRRRSCTLQGAKDCGLGTAGRKRLPRAQTSSKGKLWQPGASQKTPVCRMDAQAGDSRAHGPKATRRGGRWRGARDESHVRVRGATESPQETSRNHEAHRQSRNAFHDRVTARSSPFPLRRETVQSPWAGSRSCLGS